MCNSSGGLVVKCVVPMFLVEQHSHLCGWRFHAPRVRFSVGVPDLFLLALHWEAHVVERGVVVLYDAHKKGVTGRKRP